MEIKLNIRLRRIGWLILIWGVSVAALGIFALLFRLVMSAVGLTR
jgi:hypothetical protein